MICRLGLGWDREQNIPSLLHAATTAMKVATRANFKYDRLMLVVGVVEGQIQHTLMWLLERGIGEGLTARDLELF